MRASIREQSGLYMTFNSALSHNSAVANSLESVCESMGGALNAVERRFAETSRVVAKAVDRLSQEVAGFKGEFHPSCLKV